MGNVKGYFNLINDQYSKFLAKEIILAYDGDVTHQIMKAFTNLVEAKLENEKEKETVIRRLYHVLVECLQNINKHAEIIHTEDGEYFPGRGALMVSKSETFYRVITVNIIRNSLVNTLNKFLVEINPLSNEELNTLYKQQLLEGKLSSKGGAGLGFIDIRRKTENLMEFKFIKNDENTSFFLFNVIISR